MNSLAASFNSLYYSSVHPKPGPAQSSPILSLTRTTEEGEAGERLFAPTMSLQAHEQVVSQAVTNRVCIPHLMSKCHRWNTRNNRENWEKLRLIVWVGRRHCLFVDIGVLFVLLLFLVCVVSPFGFWWVCVWPWPPVCLVTGVGGQVFIVLSGICDW